MFNPYSMSPYDVSLQTAAVHHRHGRSLGIPEGHVPTLLRSRAQTENMRRRPMLGLRTRSDFTRSATPLGDSPYSPSVSSFQPGSQCSPSTSTSEFPQWQEDRPESFTRSLLAKSSMLLRRKNSNRANLTSLRILEWVEDTESTGNDRQIQGVSKRRRSKNSRNHSVGSETMLKQSISDPYNFQHLTHTGAHHAKALRNASQSDLVTEFSAIRASQAPHPELKGIRADCLHSRKNSVDLPLTLPVDGPTTPTSLSPSRTRDQWSKYAQRDLRSLRYSQSVDNLARITPRSFSSPTPPISPPPRRSSKGQSRLPYDPLATAQDSPTRPSFPRSPLILNHSRPMDSPTLSGPSAVGHAITTPDDTAFTLNPCQRSPSGAGLADVPEEDEGYPWMRHPGHIPRPSTASSAIRHTKSFPSTSCFPLQSGSSPAYSHSSSSTERNAGSDPTLPLYGHETEEIPSKRRSQHPSTETSFMENSWEEDIDYCYEHAAEADCAFDWDRVSIDEDRTSSATKVIDDIIESAASSFENIPDEGETSPSVGNDSNASFPGASRSSSYDYIYDRPSPLVTRHSNATLPHSSISSTITVPGIITPAEPTFVPQIVNQSARTSQGSVMFNLSPSLLIPKEYTSRPTDDDVFQDRTYDGEFKHQFPIFRHRIDTGVHRDGSILSNDSPLSTCHSQESMLPSPATSIDPRCRNSSSMGSLPELVFSKNSRSRPENISVRPTGQTGAGNTFRPVSDTLPPSILRKTTSTTSFAEQSPVASAPASVTGVTSLRRERSQSDSADQTLKVGTANSAGESSTGRIRSKTSVSSFSGTKSRRTSTYSLFPSVTTR